MAGNQHTAAPVPDQRQNRRATLAVEVIGRLIKQQKFRLFEQQARHADARPFPTAQRTHGAVMRDVGQANFSQCRLHVAFKAPVRRVEIIPAAGAIHYALKHCQCIRDPQRIGH